MVKHNYIDNHVPLIDRGTLVQFKMRPCLFFGHAEGHVWHGHRVVEDDIHIGDFWLSSIFKEL